MPPPHAPAIAKLLGKHIVGYHVENRHRGTEGNHRQDEPAGGAVAVEDNPLDARARCVRYGTSHEDRAAEVETHQPEGRPASDNGADNALDDTATEWLALMDCMHGQ